MVIVVFGNGDSLDNTSAPPSVGVGALVRLGVKPVHCALVFGDKAPKQKPQVNGTYPKWPRQRTNKENVSIKFSTFTFLYVKYSNNNYVFQKARSIIPPRPRSSQDGCPDVARGTRAHREYDAEAARHGHVDEQSATVLGPPPQVGHDALWSAPGGIW